MRRARTSRHFAVGGAISLLILSAMPATAAPVAVPPKATAYPDLIAPILNRRCSSCHGERKQKGELRLDSLEAIRAGGKSGPAVVSGSSVESLLMQRLDLPLDDLDHMPPEEKTQLTDVEVSLLRWWLDAGLPATESIGDLDLPAGLVQWEDPTPPGAPPPPEARDEDWGALQEASQLLILPVSQSDSTWLHVSTAGRAGQIGDDAIRALIPIAPRIAYLNLSRTPITDAALETVGAMAHLEWLALDRTLVSDAGIPSLAPLSRLRHLNLSGTRVTDAAVPTLQQLPSLHHVYAGGTQISESAAIQLQDRLNARENIPQLREELALAQSRLAVALARVSRGIQPSEVTTVAAPPDAMVNPMCPVSGEPVDPAFTLVHQGQRIGFCCGNCLAKFEADPGAFPLSVP